MGRVVTRTHRGLLLHLLYPLGGTVPGLRRVPEPVRRRTRRALTSAGVRVHLRRCRDVRIATVVGSRGKTTAKDLLAAMLAPGGRTVKTRQNDNDVYGLPASLLALRGTDRYAVLEAGIRDEPGDMRWLARLLRPELVVLTGIGGDHISAYGSREALAAEKRAMLERLPATGTAVINADDPLARSMASGLPCKVTLAGRAQDADFRLVDARPAWPHGFDVAVTARGRRYEGRVPVFGRHLTPVVALCLAAAAELGVSPEEALAGARSFVPPPGRLQPLRGPGGSTVLMDDAKSRLPIALASLAALGEMRAERRIAVLGELQDLDGTADGYAPVAERVREHVDLLVTVGGSGDPLRSLLAAGPGPDVESVERVEEAADLLRGRLGEHDAVLVHGANGQHLQRILLLLEDRDVRCRVRRCTLHWRCTDCPWLTAGPPSTVVEAA